MNRRQEAIRAFRAAFPLTVPVLTGFAFLGMAYGILMSTKGYGVIWIFLMSAVAFCGSMQYAAVTLLTAVFQPVQALLLSLMVNARHLFYGISMLDRYRGLGRVKPFLIYTLCDETFSIVCSREPPEGVSKKWFYFFISALDYCYWVAGSVLGGVLGGLLTFEIRGLDFVLTALFVVIFTEQWLEGRKGSGHAASLTGIGASVVCLALFGKRNFIIPAMLLIVFVLCCFRNWERRSAGREKAEGGKGL